MAHSQQQRVSLTLRGNLPRRQVEDDLGVIHVQMRLLTQTTCGTLCCAVQQKMMFWNEEWSNKMPKKIMCVHNLNVHCFQKSVFVVLWIVQMPVLDFNTLP